MKTYIRFLVIICMFVCQHANSQSINVVGYLNSQEIPTNVIDSIVTQPDGNLLFCFHDGNKKCILYSEINKITTTGQNCKFPVIDSLYIDGEGYYIDLGLPSGVLWAQYCICPDMNIDEPEYEQMRYTYEDCIKTTSHTIGQLPNSQHVTELINNCTWTWGKNNGMYGYNIVGPNGNRIFIIYDSKHYYWTSDCGDSSGWLIALAFTKDEIRLTSEYHSSLDHARLIIDPNNYNHKIY